MKRHFYARPRFCITYQIVTHESAADGEADDEGILEETNSLRDALKLLFDTRTSACDSGEGLSVEENGIGRVAWLTVHNGQEFRTGAYESRTLHIRHKGISLASARRIAALARKYGR